jgi:hypothetical protein
MLKKIFTVARNDKRTRKKAIEVLGKQENLIDAEYFINESVSSQINAFYQDPNDFM